MDFTLYALLKAYVKQTVAEGGIAAGKSAYEIAQDNGFIGTEQEWLKSLQGQTPYIGENGNWFVGSLDTGTSASPIKPEEMKKFYTEENLLVLSDNEILEICK